MQTRSCLALFCTFVVLFIAVNDGATTTKKTVTMITHTPAVIVPSPPIIKTYGGRTNWTTKIHAKSRKLFNDHKKHIKAKLVEVHKTPASFNPKPEKTASQVVSGYLTHYLIKLPVNKYAHVTILEQKWKKEQYGKAEHVNVKPELYSLNDKNVM